MPKAKRGEIWMTDLGLAAKVRPVLVLSVAYEGQERAVVSCVIRTPSLRDTQYEVLHEARGMPNRAFDAQGLGSKPKPKALGWAANVQPGKRVRQPAFLQLNRLADVIVPIAFLMGNCTR